MRKNDGSAVGIADIVSGDEGMVVVYIRALGDAQVIEIIYTAACRNACILTAFFGGDAVAGDQSPPTERCRSAVDDAS